MNNISGQSNILNNEELYDQIELFRGLTRVDGDNLALLKPYIPGKGFWLWTKMPSVMEEYDADLTEQFKNLTEKMFMGFDGIGDWSVQSEEISGGTSGKKFTIVTGVNDEFNNFSIKVPMELSGSPLRTFMDLWLTAIGDPKTGTGNYLGLLENFVDRGGWNPANHSGEGVYITTDPSESHLGIEFAAYVANIQPDGSKRSHLNTTVGDTGVPQLDLGFTGVKYESPAINELAVDMLEKLEYTKNYLDFDPDAY